MIKKISVVLAAFPMKRSDGVAHVSLSIHLLGMCIKKHLTSLGYQSRIEAVDISADTPDLTAANEILSHDPQIVGYSLYVWNFDRAISVARTMKELKTGIVSIFGGPNAEYNATELLRSHIANYVLLGEAEGTLPKLVELIATDSTQYDLHKLPGLLWYDEGEIISSRRDSSTDLHQVPSVWCNDPGKKILRRQSDSDSGIAIEVETSRGCPNQCSYCAWGKRANFRRFSMHRIECELSKVFKSTRVREVFLTDFDCFSSPREASVILDVVRAHNRRSIPVYMCAGPKSINTEIFKKVSRTPGVVISIGIQSTDEAVLRAIGRSPLSENILNRIRNARREAPASDLAFDVIFGLPMQSYNSLMDTLNDVLGLFPSSLNIHILQVLPGSILWENGMRKDLEWEQRPPYRVLRSLWMTEKEMAMARKISCWLLIVTGDPLLRNAVFEVGGAWQPIPGRNYLNTVEAIVGDSMEKLDEQNDMLYPDPNKTTSDEFIRLQNILRYFHKPEILKQTINRAVTCVQNECSRDVANAFTVIGDHYNRIIDIARGSVRFLDTSSWLVRENELEKMELECTVVSVPWTYMGYWRDAETHLNQIVLVKTPSEVLAVPENVLKDVRRKLNTNTCRDSKWAKFEGEVPLALGELLRRGFNAIFVNRESAHFPFPTPAPPAIQS